MRSYPFDKTNLMYDQLLPSKLCSHFELQSVWHTACKNLISKLLEFLLHIIDTLELLCLRSHTVSHNVCDTQRLAERVRCSRFVLACNELLSCLRHFGYVHSMTEF